MKIFTSCGLSALLFFSIPLSSFSQTDSHLLFDGTDDYVNISGSVVSGLSVDYTIEGWLYLTSNAAWQRMFDFGTGTTFNLFFTPNNGATNTPRFAITTGGSVSEQQITAPNALSLNQWHHVAIVYTVANTTGKMYLDGTLVASNTGMLLNPSGLGTTTANYLGKSQYADPYLHGKMDEFRISNSARYSANFTPSIIAFANDANTVALYHMNEGTGQVVGSTTNTYNATRGATNAAASDDPSWSTTNSIILPVKMSQLSINTIGESVLLTWNSPSDPNNKGFYIERSYDGLNFNSIGFVSAAQQAQYSYTDQQALRQQAGAVYYRLQQLDNDGTKSYSAILKTKLKSSDNASISIYPNPVVHSFAIQLQQVPQPGATVKVFNSAAVMVMEKQLTGNLTTIDISRQPKGVYYVEILENNKVSLRQSILKQ